MRGLRGIVVVALLGALVAVPGCAGDPADGGDPAVVRVADGALRGVVTTEGRAFHGVPYAAPPVGALRWRPPQAARAWDGVRPAGTPGPRCPQGASGNGAWSDTEDCLYLSVLTPPADRPGRRPVMVWLHPGGYERGGAGDYDVSRLAHRGDVVVVSVGYRLGPFGFLAHPALQDGATGPVNLGLLDQQAALRWVRRNAAAFGGDPRRVTVFGHSAGGGSVCALLASPPGRGLADRAVAQSGCSSLSGTLAAGYATGRETAERLGCDGDTDDAATAACLRRATVDRVLAAGRGLDWQPLAGDAVLPRPILEAFADGAADGVPLLHGTARDEETYRLLESGVTDDASYRARLADRFGTRAADVQARYPARDGELAAAAFAAALTDHSYACPALRVSRALGHRDDVWAYEFDDPDAPAWGSAIAAAKAFHGSELPYLFGRVPFGGDPAFTPAQRRLSDAMIGAWAGFARDGRLPGGWPAAATGRMTLLAPPGPRTVALAGFAADHRCDFWDAFRPG